MSNILPCCYWYLGISFSRRYKFTSMKFKSFTNYLGPILVNNPQTPPPSKRADGKIFLVYISDDFKTKKKCKEKNKFEKNVRIFLEKPGRVYLLVCR